MKHRERNDLAVDEFESARSISGRSTTLPPAAYRSPAFFELEVERIFTREWFCLGHVCDIPEKGDYRCVDFAGEPLVMVRDMNNEIHVMSRVCRHKWMEIVQDSGNIGSFTCPYHGWTYNLDGSLRGAPYMQNCDLFNKGEIYLPALKVEIWEGFVWANFDFDCDESLNHKLASLSEQTQRYNMASSINVHRNEYNSQM